MEVELSNVTKTIKKQEILRGINFKLQSGNIYGLRGKNGAGKRFVESTRRPRAK